MATLTKQPAAPAATRNFETIAWRWMRLSGLLLIPLVWIHVLLQDILVGVHAIDLEYVAARWANLGWRIFDIFLLGFAFAHGMNGVRQVAYEYFTRPTTRKIISYVLFFFWLVITLIGATALIMGVNQQFPLQ